MPGFGRPGFTQAAVKVVSTSHPALPNCCLQDAGHKVMADMAVWLLQQTALDLLLRPWGHADAEQLREGLPLPIMQGR